MRHATIAALARHICRSRILSRGGGLLPLPRLRLPDPPLRLRPPHPGVERSLDGEREHLFLGEGVTPPTTTTTMPPTSMSPTGCMRRRREGCVRRHRQRPWPSPPLRRDRTPTSCCERECGEERQRLSVLICGHLG